MIACTINLMVTFGESTALPLKEGLEIQENSDEIKVLNLALNLASLGATTAMQ